MSKVNRYTKAGANGKEIFCPTCNTKVIVYHFSWGAITCPTCNVLVDKENWETMSTQKVEFQYPHTIQFEATESLSLGNSFGTIKTQKQVKLDVTIGINSDTYGYFEFNDVESGGGDWYAEGGIWIKDKVITDYDGVFALPTFITDKLKDMGFDVSEVEDI